MEPEYRVRENKVETFGTRRSARRIKPLKYLHNFKTNLPTLTYQEAINGPEVKDCMKAVEDKKSLEKKKHIFTLTKPGNR